MEIGDLLFVISPKESLLEILPQRTGFFRQFITSTIWPMGGTFDFWWDDDEKLLAKLTFLLHLYQRQNLTKDLLLQEFIKSLLGEFPITSQTFDRWWDIAPGELEFGIRHLLKYVKADELKLIAKTGNAKVDAWVEFSIGMATAREQKTENE